jgi:hypothetical protein
MQILDSLELEVYPGGTWTTIKYRDKVQLNLNIGWRTQLDEPSTLNLWMAGTHYKVDITNVKVNDVACTDFEDYRTKIFTAALP